MHYEELADTKTKISGVMTKMKAVLGMYWGDEDTELLIACKGVYTTDAPTAVARVMRSGQIGMAIFSCVWLACSRQLGRDRVITAIDNLEKEEFDEDRNKNFFDMMGQERQMLRQEGHVRGKHKWINNVSFCAL